MVYPLRLKTLCFPVLITCPLLPSSSLGAQPAKEARAIHEGKSEERGIYGQATTAEVKALKADGVQVAPLPPKPPEEREIN